MIFIDTQIWIYAQKEPNEGRFENLNEYKKMLDLHQNADIFMQNCIKSHEIGMTYHQLSEIFHNLGFQRKSDGSDFLLGLLYKIIGREIYEMVSN